MISRVDLILGLECNQNCTFCFNKPIKSRYSKEDFRIERIISTLKKGRTQGIDSVSISGGEPTISSDFFNVLLACREEGYRNIRLISNGMMFSYKSFTRKLIPHKISQICISVHSDMADASEKITGVKGSFSKTIEGVKNIRKHLDAGLVAHVVLTKDNSRHLARHTKFLLDIGFEGINFLYLMPNSGANWRLAPDRQEVSRALKDVIDRFHDRAYIHIGYLEPCALPGYSEYFDTNDFDMEFLTNCPSLFEDWKKTLIQNKEQKEVCRNCPYLKICMGFWKNKAE